MKKLIYLIITLVVGWFALNYVVERTVEITLNQLEDDLQTEWVKCAKECDTLISVTDSIYSPQSDAVR